MARSARTVATSGHAGGRWADARQLLERPVQSGPKDRPELLAQLGATLRRLGDLGEAERLYRRALLLRPDARLRAELDRELAEMAPRGR